MAESGRGGERHLINARLENLHNLASADRFGRVADAALLEIRKSAAFSLAEALAAVGLARNMEALRRSRRRAPEDHMALQARNVPILVGTTGDEIEKVAAALAADHDIRVDRAKTMLESMRRANVRDDRITLRFGPFRSEAVARNVSRSSHSCAAVTPANEIAREVGAQWESDVSENERSGGLSERAGPLKGLTVLDITRVVAGPFCSMLFADMGATVIKVEHPDDPDYARTFPPFVGSEDEQLSAFFTQFNRNKLGITLNLKSGEGRELLKRLIRKTDILVENFRPGTMDKLGLGYEVLQEINPRLIYTAISGFGRTGPNASKPAYDNTGQAAGGLWSMNGYPGMPPVRVGTIIGDLAASLYAAIGTLAALREAEKTGLGQVVDVSQQDSVLTLTENAVVRYTTGKEIASPLGNDHPFVRPYGQFPCKDGYVFFGGYTDKFWAITCAMFGEPDKATDPVIDTMEKRFDPVVAETKVKPLLERWFGNYTKAELEEMAGDKVPLSAIKNIAEVVEDPHIAARRMIVDVPIAGRLVAMFGQPIKLSRAEVTFEKAPSPGEHNEMVLSRLAGVTAAEFQRLKTSGAI